MDISDAFQVHAIQAADADLTEDELDDLREWVGTLFQERYDEFADTIPEASMTADQVREIWFELCVHSFMAGRVYQGEATTMVEMTPRTASLFIDFLAERAK